MKKMISVKYKFSELRWFEKNEVEPDMLSDRFIDYVRRSSYDRLKMWFSRHFFLQLISILLLLVAILVFLENLHWISYIVCFFSIVSFLTSLYYHNLWKQNYFLVECLVAFAQSMVQLKKEKQQAQTTDNIKT